MSILANKNTRVLIQGITGTQASFHVRRSLDYGTNIVGGVTPGKGGQEHLGLPVFNTVKEAIEATGANASVLFVPATAVKSAVREDAEAGLELAVCISDNVPVRDMLEIKNILRDGKTIFVGPNTPGIITPGEARLGIFPENIHRKGKVGIVSRSGTLTYEAVKQTTDAGFGQSTCVGIGGDPVQGSSFVDMLKRFEEDDETEAVVLVGEIGGTSEQEAAAWIKEHMSKPVVSYIAGASAPEGQRMGHAGAIITGGQGTARAKQQALKDAGVIVVPTAADIADGLREATGWN